DPAAPVHARTRPRLPRRPRTGAHDRVRVVPERVRPGTGRSAPRRAAARPRPSLDRDDLDGSAVRRRTRFARTFRVTATGSPEGLRYRDSRASPSFRVGAGATGGHGAIVR